MFKLNLKRIAESLMLLGIGYQVGKRYAYHVMYNALKDPEGREKVLAVVDAAKRADSED